MLPVSRRHKQKYATTTAPAPAPMVASYATRLAQCRHDDAHLRSAYPDHTQRNRFKRGVLDKQRDYLDGLLSNPTLDTGDNEIVGWCVVWAADIQDWDLLLKLAIYCTGKPISLPRGIKRAPSVFAADALFQALEPLLKDDRATDIQLAHFRAFVTAIEAGTVASLHPLTAKYFKLLGALLERDNSLSDALNYYQNAQSLSDSIGCKGRIDDLTQRLKTVLPAPVSISSTGASLATSSPTPSHGVTNTPTVVSGDRGDGVFLGAKTL